jgi:hypothetical protein
MCVSRRRHKWLVYEESQRQHKRTRRTGAYAGDDSATVTNMGVIMPRYGLEWALVYEETHGLSETYLKAVVLSYISCNTIMSVSAAVQREGDTTDQGEFDDSPCDAAHTSAMAHPEWSLTANSISMDWVHRDDWRTDGWLSSLPSNFGNKCSLLITRFRWVGEGWWEGEAYQE